MKVGLKGDQLNIKDILNEGRSKSSFPNVGHYNICNYSLNCVL